MGFYIKHFGVGQQVMVAGTVANQSMKDEGYFWYEGTIPDNSSSMFLKWDGEKIYEDTDERIIYELISVRLKRDKLLTDTDWMIIKCQERGISIPKSVVEYRQSLRDITENYTVGKEVSWPQMPDVNI